MKANHWVSAALLGSTAQVFALPGRSYYLRARSIADNANEEVQVVLSSATTLEDLASKLIVDTQCLIDANFDISTLNAGDSCTVPYHCCGTSCMGDFCSKRYDCHNQTTSSAPAQTYWNTSTVVSTITTSVYETSAPAPPPYTASVPVSSSIPVIQNSSVIGTSSVPVVIIPSGTSSLPGSAAASSSASSGAVPLPSSSVAVSNSSAVPPVNSSVPSMPASDSSISASSSAFGTGGISASQSIVSSSSVPFPTSSSFPGSVAPPSSSSGPPSNSSIPSSSVVGNTSGSSSVAVTGSTSSGVASESASSGVVSGSASSSVAVTGSASSGVASGSASSAVVSGSTSSGVVSASSSSGVVSGSASSGTITGSASSSVASGSASSGVVSGTASSSVASGSASSGVVSGSSSSGVVSGSASSGVITGSASASSGPITGSASSGPITASASSGSFSAPVTVTTSTLPDGSETTITLRPSDQPTGSNSEPPSPTSSSSAIVGIFPVTTSVSEPEATDDGTVIPCNFWFFNFCLDWEDTDIGGWFIDIPEGVRPPGPPPPITFPPELSITVSIDGTLPPWPSLTVGPDRLPTFEPKPTDGPDDGCETETAEVCLTSTSYGVDSATVTTTSAVLSTCATVLGCNVEDSSTETTTTSTSSGYQYYCTAGCSACLQARSLPTPTAVPAQVTGVPSEPKNLLSHAGNLTLAKRDIPMAIFADGISEVYSDVQAAGPIQVPLDVGSLPNGVDVGISSSRFRYFDNSEFNVVVRGLRGCTSVVVVSRLGVYATHFWEGPSFNGPDSSFDSDVLNYFSTGRSEEISAGDSEALVDLAEAGVFGDVDTTKIFIMTPATLDLDLTENTSSREQAASLSQGAQPALYGGNNRVGAIRNELGQILPGVPINEFVYRRQTQDNLLQTGAYGAAMILYSNNQQDDPDSGDPLEVPPQKATYQCWMQGTLMGSDLWDALPGQSGFCSGNQKRQDGGVCSLSVPEPSATASASQGASTSGVVSITPTASASANSSAVISDLPPLTQSSAVISTPAGSSCVATSTSSQCQLGSGGRATLCEPVPVCTSFVATTTSEPPPPSSTVPSEAPSSTPTGQVYINIYTDDDCIDVFEQTTLNAIGESYQPTDENGDPVTFKCFSLTYLSDAAINSGALAAIDDPSCFVQDDTDEDTYAEYDDLLEIQYEDQKPFEMGCLTLISKP